MKYLYLLLFVLIAACATSVNDICINTNNPTIKCHSSTLIRVYADEAFTQEEKFTLANAFERWSIKTNNTVRFDIIFIPTDLLIYSSSTSHTFYVFKRAPINSQFIGYTSWSKSVKGAAIEIQPNLYLSLFTSVVLHEIGHGLGLQHYEGTQKSIMTPAVNGEQDISCRDVKAFCSEWDCNTTCKLEFN